MKLSISLAKRTVLLLLALTVMQAGQFARAQQPQKPAPDDVLRINTELVQTAITVVDKQGRFVDGLSRDQFELTVDRKPRPISFFERVTAGTAREVDLARSLTGPTVVIPPNEVTTV